MKYRTTELNKVVRKLSLVDIGIEPRVAARLKEALGISSVGDCTAVSEEEFLRAPSVGSTSLIRVKEVLAVIGESMANNKRARE